MFDWFRRKPKVRRIFAGSATLAHDSAEIAARFGEILETLDIMSIYDVSRLPRPKDEMKVALKTAWRLAKTKELRDAVEVSFVSLSSFQEGVGSKPLAIGLPDPAKLTPELLVLAQRYFKRAEKMRAEMASLSAELDAFIASQKGL